jgi:hypothetical protein
MKLKNEKVIAEFIKQDNYDVESHTGNLWTTRQNNELWNYRTMIAKFDHESKKLFINVTKYSVTTSKIQTYLKRESRYAPAGYEIVEVNHDELNR